MSNDEVARRLGLKPVTFANPYHDEAGLFAPKGAGSKGGGGGATGKQRYDAWLDGRGSDPAMEVLMEHDETADYMHDAIRGRVPFEGVKPRLDGLVEKGRMTPEQAAVASQGLDEMSAAQSAKKAAASGPPVEPPEVAAARQKAAEADATIAATEQELAGFRTGQGLGPAAQRSYDRLHDQRSQAYRDKQSADYEIRAKSLEPTHVQARIDEALRDSGNSYGADDPTIRQALADGVAAAEAAGEDTVWISPPSGYEVAIPLADAKVHAGRPRR